MFSSDDNTDEEDPSVLQNSKQPVSSLYGKQKKQKKKPKKRKHIHIDSSSDEEEEEQQKKFIRSQWCDAQEHVLPMSSNIVSEEEFKFVEQRLCLDLDIALNASQITAIAIFYRRYINGSVELPLNGGIVKAMLSILGNPVGTGKTRIILGLIALLKTNKSMPAPSNVTLYQEHFISPLICFQNKVKHVPCTIVSVGNDQISVQWEREAKICGLSSFTVFTNKHADKLLELAETYDVLIVRGIGFKMLLVNQKHIYWDLFVLDEPDCHVNPGFKHIIPARFHILVTATWDAIKQVACSKQNYLSQIGLRSEFVHDYNITKALVVRTAEELKMPVLKTNLIYFKPTVGDAMLRGLFSAEVDRLIDSDNWEAVAKIIGTKLTKKTLPEVAMESMQNELKNAQSRLDDVKEIQFAFEVDSEDYNQILQQVPFFVKHCHNYLTFVYIDLDQQDTTWH